MQLHLDVQIHGQQVVGVQQALHLAGGERVLQGSTHQAHPLARHLRGGGVGVLGRWWSEGLQNVQVQAVAVEHSAQHEQAERGQAPWARALLLHAPEPLHNTKPPTASAKAHLGVAARAGQLGICLSEPHSQLTAGPACLEWRARQGTVTNGGCHGTCARRRQQRIQPGAAQRSRGQQASPAILIVFALA